MHALEVKVEHHTHAGAGPNISGICQDIRYLLLTFVVPPIMTILKKLHRDTYF